MPDSCMSVWHLSSVHLPKAFAFHLWWYTKIPKPWYGFLAGLMSVRNYYQSWNQLFLNEDSAQMKQAWDHATQLTRQRNTVNWKPCINYMHWKPSSGANNTCDIWLCYPKHKWINYISTKRMWELLTVLFPVPGIQKRKINCKWKLEFCRAIRCKKIRAGFSMHEIGKRVAHRGSECLLCPAFGDGKMASLCLNSPNLDALHH
jgi:hypothetical protein